MEVTIRLNEYQQPTGAALPDWQGVHLPGRKLLAGRYRRLERIDAAQHAAELYEHTVMHLIGVTGPICSLVRLRRSRRTERLSLCV